MHDGAAYDSRPPQGCRDDSPGCPGLPAVDGEPLEHLGPSVDDGQGVAQLMGDPAASRPRSASFSLRKRASRCRAASCSARFLAVMSSYRRPRDRRAHQWRDGRADQTAVRQVTNKPILYVVNTNYHGDHTFGNYAFPPETLIVAQQKTAESMRDFEREKRFLLPTVDNDPTVVRRCTTTPPGCGPR